MDIVYYTLITIFSLMIGSFLNVVICRYPIMLKRAWKKECHEFLSMPIEEKRDVFNIAVPRSHCPNCKTPLKIRHYIPIISYLMLKGKCATCRARISPAYPIIELIAASLALWTAIHFGLTWQTLCAIILGWCLIVMSVIDLNEQFIPDEITLSLVWIGLFISLFHLFTTPPNAILGAIIGYLMLWIVAKLFFLVRKKEGMGHGDFKMLAMFGAWMGTASILNTIFIAVIIGLIFSIALLIFGKITREKPIPFGPFIAIGGWITLFYGPLIIQWIAGFN